MNNAKLKKKIAYLIKEAPKSKHQPAFKGRGSVSVVDTMRKDASLRKSLDSILKGIIGGSNFLSSIPERIANTAKIQIFGGRELSRLAGPFTPSKKLKNVIKTQLKGKSPGKSSLLRTGKQGDVVKSLSKNVYIKGEKIEGVTGLAKNMFSGKSWKQGANKVFGPVGRVGSKEITNKGAQRALGFLANNPMDIALTAMDYQAAKSRKEKNEVIAKGIPSFMLTNTIANLGGKRYSLMSNMMASAIAHKAVNTAWKAAKKDKNERKIKKISH
jgi:hypothetical protein